VADGLPVEIGVPVYNKAWGFDNPKSSQFLSGTINMPEAGDSSVGGHAILIVGYDKNSQRFIIRNSWGTDRWGSTNSYGAGYGTIPFAYVQKYAIATTAALQ
jgi:C1A family cysteine protease